MPINIKLSRGATLVQLQDGATDTSNTSLSLVGVNASGYAQAIGQNFVYMLENFSSPTPPMHPLVGQIWHDSSAGVYRSFNGSFWEPIESMGRKSSAPSLVYLRSPSYTWAVSVDDTGALKATRVS